MTSAAQRIAGAIIAAGGLYLVGTNSGGNGWLFAFGVLAMTIGIGLWVMLKR